MTIRSYDEGYDEGVAAERARCVALVQHRVKLWNDSLRADMHGDCAMSLAEECEDIAAAIQRGNRALEQMHPKDEFMMKLMYRASRYEHALTRIAAIENKEYGPDWEEIDEAREIAREALKPAK